MAGSKDADLQRIKEINKQLDTQKLKLQDIEKLYEERIELLKKWEESSATQLQDAEENLKIMQEYAKLTGDQVGVQDTLLEVATQKVALAQDELVILRDKAKEEGQMTADLAKQIKAQEQLLETAVEQQQTLEKQQAALEDVTQAAEGFAMGLFGSVDASTTLAGQLFLASGHAGGVSAAMGNIGKGLASALKPANLMAGMFAKMQGGAKAAFGELDSFRKELALAGASLDQYGGLMANVTDETLAAGVGIEQAKGSIIALHKNMSSFNTMAAADQQVLANTTAVMSKLGVSAETSAGNFEIMTKSMSLNAQEANTATMEIAATAQALGVSQEQMAQQFQAAAPQLSAYGAEGVQVFRELAAQSKATGIEMGALLGIAGQFDTFEGAAEAAGKLNAVLGTQLNSVELLTATEDERIKILQQSVAASGKSWESMNKFEKQTVAAAAGIQDVNEAGKLFGTTAQQMENAAGAAQKMALADKELAAQAAKASTAQEKWALIQERFTTMFFESVGPLIELAHKFLDTILAIDQAMGGALIPTLIAVVGVMFLASKAQAAFNVAQQVAIGLQKTRLVLGELWQSKSKIKLVMNKLLKKSNEELAESEKKVGEQQQKAQNVGGGFLNFLKALGKILTKNAKGFLAFGAAMLMVGTGIGIAAVGMAQFVKAFSGMDPLQILAVSLAIGVFMGAIILLAKVMVTAGLVAIGPMLAFGAAFLMIGAGVALAGIGMSKFVGSIVSMVGVVGGIVMSAYAVGLLTSSIITLASALLLINTEELKAVAEMAQGFGSITLESAVAFGDAMVETKKTVVAMAQEPQVTQSLTTIAQAFTPAATVAGAPAAPATAIAQATTGGRDSGNRTIVLKLDNKVLGQAVINIFEKEQNLNKLG